MKNKTETKGDDAAFAKPNTENTPVTAGLTKREYFAAMALSGLMSQGGWYSAPENAVRLADGLIKELNK